MNSIRRYVFGSLVNGDIDNGSDIDVLVIDEHKNKHIYPPSWSVYSEERLKGLYQRGTLFAWHLFLEAVPVSHFAISNNLLRELGEPSKYSDGIKEIDELFQLMVTAYKELEEGTPSSTFELGLISVSIRDIAMAASIDTNKKFCFSKFAPYKLEGIEPPMPISIYKSLLDCRRATIRGAAIDLPPLIIDIVLKMKLDIFTWVSDLKAVIRK